MANESNAVLLRRSQLLRDIESTVRRYESERAQPLSLCNLNRKYGRRAREFGGVTGLVEDMEKQGLLMIRMTEVGGYDLSVLFLESDLQKLGVTG